VGVAIAGHLAMSTAVSGTLSETREVEFATVEADGKRLADKVASFGGSWTFIILFGGILLAWIGLNSFVLIHSDKALDSYPYILLNLPLSMLAAIQAPIIIMSQNRQAAKDRADAENDYEVNLKAELEIMALHEKIDSIRQKQLEQLLLLQQNQLDMIKKMIEDAGLKTSSS
jgi:uncharacterized membrane protein